MQLMRTDGRRPNRNASLRVSRIVLILLRWLRCLRCQQVRHRATFCERQYLPNGIAPQFHIRSRSEDWEG